MEFLYLLNLINHVLDRRRNEQAMQIRVRDLGWSFCLSHEEGKDVHRQSTHEGYHTGTSSTKFKLKNDTVEMSIGFLRYI